MLAHGLITSFLRSYNNSITERWGCVKMEKTYYVKRAGKTYIDVNDLGITIRRKGMLNMMNQGLKGEKSIPFSSISAVQLKKPGITSGYIQFSLLGGNESRGGVTAAVRDENSVMIAGKDEYEDMLELKEFIEQRMLERNQHQIKVQPAPSAPLEKSPVEQVKELKELLDMGIITQQEFDTKKNQLLGL